METAKIGNVKGVWTHRKASNTANPSPNLGAESKAPPILWQTCPPPFFFYTLATVKGGLLQPGC